MHMDTETDNTNGHIENAKSSLKSFAIPTHWTYTVIVSQGIKAISRVYSRQGSPPRYLHNINSTQKG